LLYKLDFSEGNSLVTVTPEGNYSMNNVLDLIRIVLEHPLYNPTNNILIDMSNMKYTPVISEIFTISEFTVSMKKHFKGKTAMIVQGDVLYSMFKLSTIFVAKQGLKSNIFHNVEDALTWLTNSDSSTEHHEP
jgi:hypothetical protein